MLAILMVVSLTACGQESVGTPGGEDPFYRQFQQQYDVISGMGISTGRIVLNGWPHGFGSDGGWVKNYAAWLETIFA